MSGLYTRVAEITVDQMELYGQWVAVEENLGEKTHASGLVEIEKKAATVGRVLGVGVKVAEDLREGDIVLYEAWMGGRWDIGDQKMLIMDIENVLMDGLELRQILMQTLANSLKKSAEDRAATNSGPHYAELTGRIEALSTMLEFLVNAEVDPQTGPQENPPVDGGSGESKPKRKRKGKA